MVAPRGRRHHTVGRVAARVGGQSLLVTYVSLLVLVPLAALMTHAFGQGWSGFWSAATQTEAIDALRLTVLCAAGATVINAVMGTVVAWVLARDRFWGRTLLDAVIDLPFALPTVVAGVTFLTLYGPHSPVDLNATGSWTGVTIAIMFVTLPFTVRSLQPVIAALPLDAEAAAATLGARPTRIFLTVTLPALAPAILTGAGLAFARAIGEYGSVVFISGNVPYRTEVASSYIYSLVGSSQNNSAAAVAVVLLLFALVTLGLINAVSRKVARRRG